MSILAPLAPYMGMIKRGAILALLIALTVTSCNYGKNLSAVKVAELTNKVQVLEDANRQWAEAAKVREEEARTQAKEMERLQREAEKAANRVDDKREDTDKRVERNQNRLEDARRDPKCNELLELMVCPTVPLP